MKTRFEIPVELGDYNIFAIDDFLRSIRTPEQCQKLIATVGYSAARRRAYETEHGLPSGAVELAMLAQDRRVKELGEKLNHRLGLSQAAPPTPQQLKAFYSDAESLTSGLRELYPEALRFLRNYGVLAQRNKRTYAGDYHFGNDYRILLANSCPGPFPASGPGGPVPFADLATYTYVLWWLYASVLEAVDVLIAAVSILLAIALAAVWLVVIAAPGLVIP
jgi:hypothetical protein